MAATDAPATLSELRTDFLNALKEVTGVTAVNTIADRYLNKGLIDMHQEPWPWAERRAVILTHAPYTTGTIDILLATRTTVTGTSTLWNTAVTGMGFNNARALGKLRIGTDVYVVSSVDSDTQITLQDRYVGATALDDSGYTYFEDEYALPADFDRPVDLRYFNEDRTIELIGAQEFYVAFARNSQTGPPKWASLIELGPSGSVALRKRILFAPPPDAQMVIPYRYLTTNLAVSSAGVLQAQMSGAADEPIVPLRWRQGIVYKALELWARDRKDDQRSTEYAASYTSLTLRARQWYSPGDDRPRMIPKVAHYRLMAKAPYAATGTRRYTTGTRWDELRE